MPQPLLGRRAAGSTALSASDITWITGTSETGIQQDALMPDHFRGDAAEEPLLSEPDGAEDWKAKKG